MVREEGRIDWGKEREKGREGKGRRRGGDRKPPPLKPKAKPHLLVGRRAGEEEGGVRGVSPILGFGGYSITYRSVILIVFRETNTCSAAHTFLDPDADTLYCRRAG